MGLSAILINAIFQNDQAIAQAKQQAKAEEHRKLAKECWINFYANGSYGMPYINKYFTENERIELMKNHKQLLADFYLALLSIPMNEFRITNQKLYATVREVLAYELDSDNETIQRIFERMAEEDAR